jgi:hypothetical protein
VGSNPAGDILNDGCLHEARDQSITRAGTISAIDSTFTGGEDEMREQLIGSIQSYLAQMLDERIF